MNAVKHWTVSSVRVALDSEKSRARTDRRISTRASKDAIAELNVFLALSPERAYAQADRIDGMRARDMTAIARRRSRSP